MSAAQDPRPPRPRREMSLSERVRARDSYGVLFVLIVVALFASTLRTEPLGTILRPLTMGAVLLFALHTSGASRREFIVAAGIVVIAGLLSFPFFEQDSRIDRAVESGASLLLGIGVLGAIARRVGTHPVVSGATIAAALCIYLMVGLSYGAAYGLVGAIDSGPAFRGTSEVGGDGSTLEHTYFSFTTMTTVGFGDLAPVTDVMRILAVTEAFTGQLYLVTVVALLIGNLGRERRGSRDRDGSSDQPPG